MGAMVSDSDLKWPLLTERLLIRPATPLDVEVTWEHRRLPEVSRWISWEAATFEEYAEGFLHPERLATTLVIEHDGTVIGDLMLRVEDAWAQAEVRERAKGVQAELGWCLHPSAQGQGLATEAVAALMELCFEQLGLRRVVANCFADNEGSWRLMERLAMRREVHTIRESLHRSGEWLDGLGYALLAEEWLAHRSSGAKT
jgi:RimJ/RimL family protein N-acetyltransferase